ncbi:MAG: glycosyltransferase family 1 protein [Corynebacterium sp.]|nr:glycosyltransferase family 1 protein [Corynebacterium sp.]
MRVAIVTESFLPQLNGVTNSVLKILDYLRAHGHDAIVIAPGARKFEEEVVEYAGFRIVCVPTIMFPGVNSLPLGVPVPTVSKTLAQFKPDIVHAASPFVLGAAGIIVARNQRIPSIAVYQTDVAGFAQRYRFSALHTGVWEWTKTIHNMAQRTLAPSSVSISELEGHGIHSIYHWGRGVDAQMYHPDKRSDALRLMWEPTGMKPIIGFVGRLAAEKSVHRLAVLDEDYQLVIVGDGPQRDELEELLPNAVFTGALKGEELAQTYASFDVFVHTGEFETFCQTIQEAHASGVPVIAPRAGGPIDLVTEGVDGYLLDVAHFEEQLPERVEEILSPIHHPRMSQSARAAVTTKTWDNLCAQLVGHYEAVLEQARRVPLTIFGPVPDLPTWAAKTLGARVH